MNVKLILLLAVAVGMIYLLTVAMLRIVAILPSKIARFSLKLRFLDLGLLTKENTLNIDKFLYDDKDVDKNVLRYVMSKYYEDSDLYLINYKENRDKYIKIAEEKLEDSNRHTRDATISFLSYHIEALGRERYFNTTVNRFKTLFIILFVFMLNFVTSTVLICLLELEVISNFIIQQSNKDGVISKYLVKVVKFLSSKYYLATFINLTIGMVLVLIVYTFVLGYINQKENNKIKNEAAKLELSQVNAEVQEDQDINKDIEDKNMKK